MGKKRKKITIKLTEEQLREMLQLRSKKQRNKKKYYRPTDKKGEE